MRAGQLIEISSGTRRAVVTEQGATLYRVMWDGGDVLDTASEDGYAGKGCHGQLLMPWPGRVRNGSYEFDGQRYQLAIDDPNHHSAIHGWVRWATWQVREHRADRVVMGYRHFATPGFPWPLEFEQSYSWTGEGLECRTTVKNLGDGTAPFGFGAHPYFSVGSPTIDSGVLQVRANQYYRPDEHLTPRFPAVPVEGSPYDFRQPRPVGDVVLDVTLTGLERDSDGRAVVKFRAADGSVTITLKYEEPINYVQLFSGDTLDTGRRQGLAIEPYTCLPDAFNNGTGLIRLSPGASARLGWSLAVS